MQESSLETYAVSIESDSLNQDDQPRDDKKKELKRTKSVGDIAEESVSKQTFSMLSVVQFRAFLEAQ